MNLKELRGDFYHFSGKLSDLSRQLCFAGIGVIWIFRIGGENNAGIVLGGALVRPLLLFALSLAGDLFHYVYQAAVWGFMGRYFETRKPPKTENLEWSKYWNWPSNVLLWSKVALCVVGYLYLLRFLAGQVTEPAG